MRILIVLAGVTAVAGAAEPTAPRPSSASKAWATAPAAPPPTQGAEKPAADAATPASSEKPSAALEPAVQTSTPAATSTAPAPRPVTATPPARAEEGAARRPATRAAADVDMPAVTASAAVVAGTRGVRDRLELDTTQITGNRELPRVMYVVPWKRADLGDLAGRPVNSLLDEALEPVDRDVFRRQNRYYQALRPDTGR